MWTGLFFCRIEMEALLLASGPNVGYIFIEFGRSIAMGTGYELQAVCDF